MKWFDGSKISLVLLGFVVGLLVVGGRSANADFTFGTPTHLGWDVNWEWLKDSSPSISADGLTLFFDSRRFFGRDSNIWVTSRPTTEDDWDRPRQFPSTTRQLDSTVNSSSNDGHPSISADGLMLYFASDRPGGYGDYDLWVTTRQTTDDEWSTPVNLGPTINSSAHETAPDISADGLSLFFDSNRSGGQGDWDIWVTTRATTSDPWGTPVNLGPPVNSSAIDGEPSISADGLWLFFMSDRPGGYGDYDLWVTTRKTTDDEWGTPVNLGPSVNRIYEDMTPDISADGSTLYFSAGEPVGFLGLYEFDLWQVPVMPVADFNGDGIVDCVDICMMVDHWGTHEPLYDIGPTPLGDGIVDVQDLIVLAEYLTKEVVDPNLVAH